IPLGMALLPWGRAAAGVGLVILSPFAVASFRLLIDLVSGREADWSHSTSPIPAPPNPTSSGTGSVSRDRPPTGESSHRTRRRGGDHGGRTDISSPRHPQPRPLSADRGLLSRPGAIERAGVKAEAAYLLSVAPLRAGC